MDNNTSYQGADMTTPPKNWLVENILTTVLCGCLFNQIMLIVGIIGIVFSAQVSQKFTAGDIAGAEQSARTGRILFLVNMGILALTIIVVVIVVVFFGAALPWLEILEEMGSDY